MTVQFFPIERQWVINSTFDFSSLLVNFISQDLKFIVIGGVACALNGFIRATEDLDILIEGSDSNINKLLVILNSWGEGHSKELSVSDFPLSPGAVRIIEDFPLDVFTIINGKTYYDLLPQTKKNKNEIYYLNPRSLIETKNNTHREKDSIDILALKRIIEESL